MHKYDSFYFLLYRYMYIYSPISLVEDIESPIRLRDNGSIRVRIWEDKMIEGKLKKGKNLGSQVVKYGKKWWWLCWGVVKEGAKANPKDVPKGHFVVYVGEDWKRYVIEIGVLRHPLFKILLDSAEEMFGFDNGNSKLYLPCKECVFVTILQCVHSSNL